MDRTNETLLINSRFDRGLEHFSRSDENLAVAVYCKLDFLQTTLLAALAKSYAGNFPCFANYIYDYIAYNI
jgi:hypothetical protein